MCCDRGPCVPTCCLRCPPPLSPPSYAYLQVVPMAVSDAQLRAPEEMHGRQTGRAGILQSRGEMSAEARAADRQVGGGDEGVIYACFRGGQTGGRKRGPL